MQYYILNIDDSGAIEEIDYEKIDGDIVAICKMYDDNDFNKLNDILHSTNEYIINEKALNIFKDSKTINYKLRKAKVLRKEKLFGIFRKNNSYEYFNLTFPDENVKDCYDWIDFKKSEIFAINENDEKFKITSHQHKLNLISENKSDSDKSYSFKTDKVVFGKNFDSEIDLFKIPHYSWGIYVSERLKNKLENAKITNIQFSEDKEKFRKIWKPHFPRIEFEK